MKAEMSVVEELERRTHLAATPLSAYWPLKPGWQWVYNEVDDGKDRTNMVSILPGTIRVHGERAWQMLEDDNHGAPETTLQNVSASGNIQIHRDIFDTGRVTINPPWTYPKYAKVGQRSVMDGELDLVDEGLHLKGHYHVDIAVVKMEQVRVAAGVFSTVKIRSSISMIFRYNSAVRKLSIQMTGTDYTWLAKGIGKVKEIFTDRTVTTTNGREKVKNEISKESLRSFTAPAS